MSTSDRKQREFQEREARILEVAHHMLLVSGYHGLNMDHIATELQYSKGTIYNHFRCKEEIILALVNQTADRRAALFEKAALFRGLPRERLFAIGMAAERFVQRFPEHFQVEQMVRSSTVWEKTTEERQQVMRGCERRCVGTVAGIVRDGVAHGHLQLPPKTSAEDIVFALWSLNLGAFSIMSTSASLTDLGIADPLAALRLGISSLLDGYGWLPLSNEHDYRTVMKRIQKEVFSDD